MSLKLGPRTRSKQVCKATCSMILGLLLAQGLALAAAPADDDRWLPVAEIREGMRGYGLTVFHGSRVDTFGVRVLGVQEKVRAAGSVILIELSGQDLELSGVPQGMSGSPVFLDGRLAGAVAMGWLGGLKPIAGVTPAEEMLAMPQTPVTPEGTSGAAGTSLSTSPQMLLDPAGEGRALASQLFGDVPSTAPVGAAAPPTVWPAWPDPSRLAADLILGSSVASMAGAWQPLPTTFVYQPLGGAQAVGANSSGAISGPRTLRPGSACAIPLVLGDAQLGVVGTTTWVDGEEVYLMGHPFLQRGPVALPLATAEIFGIFPSRQMSFKLGSMGEVIGSVQHDLRAGLTGRIGAAPPLIPVDVTVRRTAGVEHYAFAVVEDAQLTPGLVFWTIYNSLLVRGDDLSQQTFRYDVHTLWESADGSGQEPVRLTGAVAGPASAADLAPEWMAPLQILLNSRHGVLRLKEVRAEVEVARPMAVAEIAAADASARVMAGQSLPVSITLQPRRGSARQLQRELRLPAHLPAGPYRLLVASARDLFALEAERAAGRFADRSLPATLELIRASRSASELVVVLFSPSRGVVVAGRELADLPASVATLLRNDDSGRVSRTLADIVASDRHDTGSVLEGHVIRKIELLATTAPVQEGSRP